MSEFKVGDKIVEIGTGDQGFITEKNYMGVYSDSWWVDWITGVDSGRCYHLREESMKVIEKAVPLFTQEQLAFLDERYGFKKDE
jgi:hypothetical protein